MSTSFTCSVVETGRIRTNVWASGPEDGVPVLLVHGNLSTGGYWRWVAEAVAHLADDVRVIAPDLRGFGRTEALPIDATRGLGDMVDDVHALLETLGLAGRQRVNAVGLSMGDTDPQSSPRVVMRTFYGPGANAANVDEDFLVDELVLTRTGDDFYPGDSTPSENWPGLAPGSRGVLNTMAPTHYDASAIVDLARKPAITWIHGTLDQIVSDASLLDLATLGSLGAVPDWPGADVLPSQPMVAQMRAVLEAYAVNGGVTREVALEGVAHGIPLEVPDVVAREVVATLVR